MNQRLITIIGSSVLVVAVGLGVTWFATNNGGKGGPEDNGNDPVQKDNDPTKPAPWLERIASSDPAVRKAALGQLDQHKAEAVQAIPVLLKHLDEKDSAARTALSDTLATLARPDGPAGSEAAAKLRTDLVAALSQEGRDNQLVAALAVGKIGQETPTALPALHKALFSQDAELQRVAALVLRQVAPRQVADYAVPEGADARSFPVRWLRMTHMRTTSSDDTAVIPPLIEALKDADPAVQRWAANVFAEEAEAIQNSIDAVPALLKLFEGSDEALARIAAHGLGKLSLRDGSITPKVLAALGDAQANRRSRAAEALSRAMRPLDTRGQKVIVPRELQSAEAITALAGARKDADPAVRAQVIRTLGWIGAPAAKALPTLIQVAGAAEGDKAERLAAFTALGQIGQDSATVVPLLLKSLKDTDEAIRKSASAALARYGREALPALRKALTESDEEIRQGAILALGGIGSESREALPELTPLLKGAQPYSRVLAAAAILQIDTAHTEAMQVLGASLAEKEATIRQTALEAIRRLGPAAAPLTASVAKALADEDSSIPWRAADALGAIGPPAVAAVPALVAVIEKNPDTKRNAEAIYLESPEYRTQRCIEAIRQIGPEAKGAVPALITVLKTCADIEAADTLSILDPTRIDGVPALIAGTRSGFDNIRESSLRAIGRLGPAAKEAVAALIQRLPSESNLTSPIKETLIRLGPVAVPQLTQALEDPAVRFQALLTLGRMGPLAREAAPAMLKAAQGDLLSEGLLAIANLGETAGPVLLEAVKDPVRSRAALRALATLKGTAAASVVAPLAGLLKDPAFAEKAEVLRTLAELGPVARSAVPAITPLLKDPAEEIQAAAGLALVRCADDGKTAGPALLKLLAEAKNVEARRDAARGLGGIPTLADSSLPLVQKLLTESAPDLRVAAIEAIAALGKAGAKAVPDLIAALKDAEPNVQVAACRALGRIGAGSAEVVSALTERLKLTEPERVQAAAIAALGQLGAGAKAAAPALRDLLSALGENGFLAAERQTAIGRALWLIEGQNARAEVVALIQRQLHTLTYPQAVVEVLDLAGDLGGEARDCVSLIGPRVDSGYQHTRQAAVAALARIGPAARSALPWLQRATTQETDPELRQQAKDAIAAIQKG